MKEQDCPNCGASGHDTISEGEYKCQFCGTLFFNENLRQQRINAEKKAAYQRAQEARYNALAEQARNTNKMGRRVLLFVGIALVIIFGFIFYMAKSSMEQSAKAQEEMIRNLKNP